MSEVIGNDGNASSFTPPATPGVWGDSGNDGTGGPGSGVIGSSLFGSGVYGVTFSNLAPGSGPPIAGVAGVGPQTGVVGAIKGATSQPSDKVGVYGTGANGSGLNGIGVEGVSDGNSGVIGISSTGDGVAGKSNAGSGVAGSSATGFGVSGDSNSNVGVNGTSNSGIGVSGTSSGNVGVLGSSTSGAGVHGASSAYSGVLGSSIAAVGVTGLSNTNTGVVGTSNSGVGVVGTSTSNSAVIGNSSSGIGVSGTSSSNFGVSGSSTSGTAVWGTSNQGYGVFGLSQKGNALGAWTNGTNTNAIVGFGNSMMTGDLNVFGAISKGGGGFLIDHPEAPTERYLAHSFVESPEMKNVYDGVVTCDARGEATVQLPSYFGTLNSDYRYLLTPIGAAAPSLYIAAEIQDGHFKIAGGAAGLKVSWQVTGVRQDAWAKKNRIVSEREKVGDERGYYLHPDLFGHSVAQGIHREQYAEMERLVNSKDKVPGTPER
jgi:hypothetical protein